MATADEVAALGVSSHEFELEVAWDGHPVLVAKAGQDVRVFADDLREWSAPAQNVALTVRDLPADELVLEGRLCVLDAHGRPDFALLKERASKGTGPAPVLMVSDVLVHDGQDLSGAPRTTRRERLPPSGAPLVRSEVLEGSLDEVLAKVRQLGLPGVIAYRRGGPREALAISATPTPLPLKRSLSMPPRVTNADKVLYPNDGITKQHVLDWYREIAPVFLPHLRDRPVVSQRWPDGIDEFTWFQHRPPPRAPDYLDAVAIDGDRRLLVQNTDALLWMVNQAALTFHTWSSRVGSLMNPDWAVVDLDPGTRTTWPQVIEVATAVRRLLELLEVPSVVKTSGQKGLHVLVPLAPGQTLEQAHRFSLGVCSMVAQLLPEAVSLSHDEKERRGRLFLDHLQNFRGKTLVAPYSLRAVDRAPVSTPLRWDEVTPSLDPRAFTRAVVLDRLAQFGDLFAPVLTRGVQLEGALAKLAGR
ncbi:MAG: non-homologous end-joining DNA ligase [Myxococcaceae bacterium]|nr:non-homologous end-joining DNA ligase [Myxococcaceae bacterium]